MLPKTKKWLSFLIVATGVFMSTLDSSMVNIALPTIMKEFHSPLRSTEWVVMIYLLTITASLLFWGHLSDRLGRRKIYSTGLLSFAVGSGACALSPSLAWLIGARFFQALGAAMMMSTGPAIIKETFPAEQLGRGLGLIGVAVSLGLMTGPSVGGLLLELYSWRALFLITVPVGLVFSLFAGHTLPAKANRVVSHTMDWPGSLAWAAALTFAALAITHATAPDWSPTAIICLLLAGTAAGALFIRIESLVQHPLLPISLLRKRFFSMAMISAVFSFMVLFSVIMLIPFYLDRILRLPSSQIGLVMMAIPASVMGVAPLAGWLSDQIGAKILTTSGLLLATAGLYLLTGLTPASTPAAIAARLAVIGCGQALFLSPNSSSVLRHVGRKQAGSSAALLATARNLGMLLGIAQAALVFSLFFSRLTGGLDMKDFSPEQVGPFMAALKGAFWAAAAVGFLGALTSWSREKGLFSGKKNPAGK